MPFLETADFARVRARPSGAGVQFEGPPRQEPCGTVAMFRDPWRNRRDLIDHADPAGTTGTAEV